MSTATTLFTELSIASPLLIVSLGALLMMMLEAFLPKGWPRAQVTVVLLVAALIALWNVGAEYVDGRTIFGGFLAVDPFAKTITYIALLGTTLAVMSGVGRIEGEGVESPGEYYTLMLLSLAGALIFCSAVEFITLFLGLEIMSMALYCLCGAALRSKRSSESALKYFLLGSFSSAFMLYGIAMIYGATGTTFFDALPLEFADADRGLLFTGLGLILLGFVFKIGGVPFHFWAPDVYEGAPTSVTVFMASVVKAAAVAATLRVLWEVFGDYRLFWSGAVWYIAALTMVVGNIVALRQRSMKRMLAYSSIAHAGYMLTGMLAFGDEFGGGAAIFYYLVTYSAMTFGSFAVLQAISSGKMATANSDDISNFNGLSTTRPVLAAVMTLFLLSLAGLPPGMAGLLGKFYIFSSVVKAHYVGLAVIGVLSSAISCYYYLRVIVAMYFVPAAKDSSASGAPQPVGVPLAAVLLICALSVILLGIFPGFIYDSGVAAAASLSLAPGL